MPTQVGARTLQLSKLMMEKAYYLHMRRLFPKMIFTDTDSVMVQIFELQDPLHAMAEANLNGAALFDVAGKSKDPESAPIEVMGLLGNRRRDLPRQDPDGARKEKRKIKGAEEGGDQRPASRVPGGAGGRQRAQGGLRAAAQPRARDRRGDVEKKSLLPFNDKVYGLDAHNSRPLGHWRSCGCWALTLPGSAPSTS